MPIGPGKDKSPRNAGTGPHGCSRLRQCRQTRVNCDKQSKGSGHQRVAAASGRGALNHPRALT